LRRHLKNSSCSYTAPHIVASPPQNPDKGSKTRYISRRISDEIGSQEKAKGALHERLKISTSAQRFDGLEANH
jgi:hypothetical protein